MFTLKVIDDSLNSGFLIPNSKHFYGGTDTTQIAAFRHLFPDGACHWTHRELLYALAEMHGWDVEVEPAPKFDNKPDETTHEE